MPTSDADDDGFVSGSARRNGEARMRQLMAQIETCQVPQVELDRLRRTPKVRKFYEQQNERIRRLRLLRQFIARFKETHEMVEWADDSRSPDAKPAVVRFEVPESAEEESDQRDADGVPLLANARNSSGNAGRRSASTDGRDSDRDPLFATPRDYYSIAYMQDRSNQMGALFEQQDADSLRARWTIRATFVANLALVLLRSLAALRSGSLAVLASTLEGCLDLVSNAIVFFTSLMISRHDILEYPTGRSRLEPLGVMLFAAITATSTFQILLKAVQQFTAGEVTEISMDPLDVALLLIVVVSKLGLWLWSRRITESLSCLALAQDHLNDVASNTLTTVFALIAARYWWWVDGLGAVLLSLLIIKNWIVVCMQYAQLLTGRSASSDQLNDLTFLVVNFEPAYIRRVDTVRAYHVGVRLFAEVDIVLSPRLRLAHAHDIGESLQVMLEQLPYVERAFVHLDTNVDHAVEHQLDMPPRRVLTSA